MIVFCLECLKDIEHLSTEVTAAALPALKSSGLVLPQDNAVKVTAVSDTVAMWMLLAFLKSRGQPGAAVQCCVWSAGSWSWVLTGLWLLRCSLPPYNQRQAVPRRAVTLQTKGARRYGTGCPRPPETARLSSGWQLVTLAIVSQLGHPSGRAHPAPALAVWSPQAGAMDTL